MLTLGRQATPICRTRCSSVARSGVSSIELSCHIHGFPLRPRRCTDRLAPFAVYAALPRSDYYEASAPRPRHHSNWKLAGVRSGARRNPWCGRWSTLPLATRSARPRPPSSPCPDVDDFFRSSVPPPLQGALLTILCRSLPARVRKRLAPANQSQLPRWLRAPSLYSNGSRIGVHRSRISASARNSAGNS